MVNSASHVTTIQSLRVECEPAFHVLQLTNINLLQKETFHLAMPQAMQHKHKAFRLYSDGITSFTVAVLLFA